MKPQIEKLWSRLRPQRSVVDREVAGLRIWIMDRGDGPFPWSDVVCRIGRAGRQIHDHDLEVRITPGRGLKMAALRYDDSELELSAVIGLGVVYASAATPTVGRPLRNRLATAIQRIAGVDEYQGVHVFDISIHDGGVWWHFMHSMMEWRAGTPWWRYGCFQPLDAAFGRAELKAEETLSEHAVTVPMPEGSYRWRVTLTRRHDGRARLPFRRKSYAYHARPLEGHHIPMPGKGENAWDCGPDAMHGQSGGIRRPSLGEVIGKIVGSAMDNRISRGADASYAVGGVHDPARPQA